MYITGEDDDASVWSGAPIRHSTAMVTLDPALDMSGARSAW